MQPHTERDANSDGRSVEPGDSILAMCCERTGVRLPHEGSPIRRIYSRVRNSLRERSQLPLGANVATRNLYLAFLRHYNAGGIFLLPSPRAEGALRKELGWLHQQGKLRSPAQVVSMDEICRVASRNRLRWFEPRSIDAGLLDIRQAYSTRPFPITWTHHTVSYREMLGGVFLPLLVSDTLPCDSIVCSSRAARAAISNVLEMIASRLPLHGQLYKGRFDVVPFGVDTDEFRPLDQRTCRRILRLPLDATILLFLGRISASDKTDLLPLAMAVSEVKKKLKNQHLLLVIAGKSRENHAEYLKEELRERGLADCIRFIPHLAESENRYLYCAADVFVSPSDNIQETFGLVVLEAMACGVPQVVSDWNGYRDLVVEGETGFLIPTMWAECDDSIIRKGLMYPGEWVLDHFQLGQSACVDIRLLSQALFELARNRELRRRMSIASRRRAEVLFNWRNTVRQYEELWTELSGIASRLPDIHKFHKSYRFPGYFRCFQGYATIEINEDTLLTSEKFCMAGSDNIVLPYRKLFSMFDPFAEWNLSEIRGIFKQSQKSIRVGDVLDLAANSGGRSEVLRQLMWLLKYGYIRAIRDVNTMQHSPVAVHSMVE